MSSFVAKLSSSLFWDVDVEKLDENTCRRFIINRVLERGNRNDWLLINQKYSLKVVVEEAQQMPSLEPKALAYIACMGGVPRESFRCYRKK